MKTFIRSAVVALAVIGSASAVSAGNYHSSTDDVRAFFEEQVNNGR